MSVILEKGPKKLGQRDRKHTTLVFGSKQRSQTIEISNISGKGSTLTKKGIADKKAQLSRSKMENTRGHKSTRGQHMNSNSRTMKMEPNKFMEEDEDSDRSVNVETPEPSEWLPNALRMKKIDIETIYPQAEKDREGEKLKLLCDIA